MGDRKKFLASASLFGVQSVRMAIWLLPLLLACVLIQLKFDYSHGWPLIGLIGLVVLALIATVFEPSVEYIFRLASQSGYDGVELLLTNQILKRLRTDPMALEQLAAKHHLMLSYHQPWDIEDGPCRLLMAAGILPRSPNQIWRAIVEVAKLSCAGDIGPLVIHSNWVRHLPEPSESLLSYLEVETVDDSKIPAGTSMVFDVGYVAAGNYLQNRLNQFAGLTAETARAYWRKWWVKFGASCRKIHFYDVDSRQKRVKNLLPGTGMLPLKELWQIAEESGQLTPGRMIVVLELTPGQLWPDPLKRLIAARKFVDE